MSTPRKRWGLLLCVVALTSLAAWRLAPAALVQLDLYRTHRAIAKYDLARAFACLHKAQARDPEKPEVQYLLGAINRRLGQYAQARDHLDRAESLGWSPHDLQRQRAMIRFQMGYIPATESFLIGLLERRNTDDNAEEIYEVLAGGYLSEYRYQEARACLQLWMQWRPESLSARSLFAALLAAEHDDERLEAELREILRIDPDRVHERLWLAQILLDRNEVELARAQCEAAQRSSPRDPRVLLGLGLCDNKLGRIEEARRYLESAMASPMARAMEPRQQCLGYLTLGQLASHEQDVESARRWYEAAVKVMPTGPAAEYGLGTVLAQLGEAELAEPHFERSKQLTQWAERLTEINQQLRHSAANVELRLEAAKISLNQGQKAESAKWMISALKYDPACRDANAMLADFYDEKGRPDLAKRHRDALDADLTSTSTIISP
jgi:tetratricopeptide (TPR) repeat protein